MVAKRALDVPRLCQAMKHSRQSLEVFRKNRTAAVREYVGNRWSEEGPGKPVYVNLLELYARTIGKKLVAKGPRLLLSTFDHASRPTVKAMEDWANSEVEKIGLDVNLSRVVFDALFSIGIMKVALARPADAAAAGWNLRAGEPFAERVDLDDFAFDPHARDFREAAWIAHRTRVPLSSVRDSKVYDKSRKDLVASAPLSYNAEGDERANVIGRGYSGYSDEEYEDMVDLWEVYLSRERRVVTLAADLGGVPYEDKGPLLEQEWVGPDCGPYHFLSFGLVPDNAMPLAPIQNLFDLHLAVNVIYRKLIRQALDGKTILAVMGGANEDGTRIMNASDGDIIRVDNPEKCKEMTFGGPNQGIFLLGEQLRNLFSLLGGNIETVGGLAPQARTATQDKLLDANAGASVSDLQDTAVRFVRGVGMALCWYWWHDPSRTMKSIYQLPGAPDVTMLRRVTPEMRRRVRWEDLSLRVDPYSLQMQTPQSRLAALNQVVTQVVVPLMGMLQQQGVSFDVHAFLRKQAEYLDMPDLPEIVTIAEPPDMTGGGDDGTTSAANTRREYVRRSVGNESPAAEGNDLSNRLASGMSQGQANGPMSPGGQS